MKQCSTVIDLMATAILDNDQMISLKEQNLNQRNQNYLDCLKSGQHSDVVFDVGGKEFQAHKLILSIHSPVFAAMFAHNDVKEAQEGKVVITDIEPDVFQELLNCIYSEQTVIKDYCVAELFVAADKVCLKTFIY